MNMYVVLLVFMCGNVTCTRRRMQVVLYVQMRD